MKNNDEIILTRKEMMRLWGIKMPTLMFLEEISQLARISERKGYTVKELTLLRHTLRRLTNEKMKR